jgi:hypothetical protein
MSDSYQPPTQLTQLTVALTTWVIPEDGDTPPLLHIGKLTTGAKHSAGPDVPVWKRSQMGTRGVVWTLQRETPCSMAYRGRQNKAMAGKHWVVQQEAE